jgi:enoyl-CoA hydratase/carnithine racemase
MNASSLFPYKTFTISLFKESKNLTLTFQQNYFNRQLTTELETFFLWLSQRLEIHSVTLQSDANAFPCFWKEEEWSNLTDQEITEQTQKIQKLTQTMTILPHIFIIDLKEGASCFGLEFSLGADFRICSFDAKISFDHLSMGLIPSCGGLSLLPKLVGTSFTRKWIFSEESPETDELKSSGLISYVYQEKSDIYLKKLQSTIAAQSSIARIQTKGALSQMMSTELDRDIKIETKYAKANFCTNDHRTDLNNFSSPQSFAKLVKFKQSNLDS